MPHTVEAFFAVFELYNERLFWLTPFFYLVSLALLVSILFNRDASGRLVFPVLAVMWLLNGIGYHLLHFSSINPAAYLFALLFVAQALLFVLASMRKQGARFRTKRDAQSVAGIGLIAYAMIIYPLLGLLSGKSFLALPHFAIAPCPTNIFTIGILLLGPLRTMRELAIIPLIWSAIGGSAVFLLSVPQDAGLIVAGLCLLIALWSASKPFEDQQQSMRQ